MLSIPQGPIPHLSTSLDALSLVYFRPDKEFMVRRAVRRLALHSVLDYS
jgi:hypothetical protein